MSNSNSLLVDYNTQRSPLLLPEYGRNIQLLAQQLSQVENRDERTRIAHSLVRLMSAMSVEHSQNSSAISRRTWDHLYILAGLSLDIDSPFPPPTLEQLKWEGEAVSMLYPVCTDQANHYGVLALRMLHALCEMEPGETRDSLLFFTACQMKRNAMNWDKESIRDEDVIVDIIRLSHGKLELPMGTALNVSQSFKRVKGRAVMEKTSRRSMSRRESTQQDSQAKASSRVDGLSSRFKRRRGR